MGVESEVPRLLTAEGTTIAVLTLESSDDRPMGVREILHARPLDASEAA
ncbi:MAG: hypothetical protein ABIL09_29235 [Gemmatimonadota bacterium]